MAWLGARLRYQHPDDWYRLTQNDFCAHAGIQFLKLYGGSPIAAVKEYFPRRRWNEWMFARVPVSFWRNRANRRRYLRWLGKRMGFCRPADWRRLRKRDVAANYGGGLLAAFGSSQNLLHMSLPDLARRAGLVASVSPRARN